jgi:hypothetical protein
MTAVLAGFAAALLGCSTNPVATPPVESAGATLPASSGPRSPATEFPIVPVSMADASSCPRTLGTAAPDSIDANAFFGAASSYGNGRLWVGGLWPDGIILGDPRFVDGDGLVSMKFGWWRVEHGKLLITGQRVDAPAPPALGDASDGYGDADFQASGVTFPTEGCWQITGTVGSTQLTFVTFVIKVPAPPTPAPSR